MNDLDGRVREAVKFFWTTRSRQSVRQGSITGVRDQGARAYVTGGKQMDGFVFLLRDILTDLGIPEPKIFCDRKLEIPGYFRPEKKWDLLVVVNGTLLAAIEFKSQVGPSFGNNFNNRTEEALGSATDLQAAYREGAFKPSQKPWLGYLMLLEDTSKSTSPVSVKEPHFMVFEEFRDASYADRYGVLLTKLLRERLYDSACFLLSPDGTDGRYTEPVPELGFRGFIESLSARALAYVRMNKLH